MTHLVRLETLNAAVNFNREVFRIIEPFVGRRVFEVGVGIGIFTEHVLSKAERVTGVDIVAEFVELAAGRFKGNPAVELLTADMGAGIPGALAGRTFDTVLCMNVLEHIEDDRRTLRDFHALLEPGGRLVLIVPQYPWLFGELDSHDGHFRRYRRADLEREARGAGFTVEAVRSFNLAGIPGWFVNGRLLRRKELPTLQMRLYDKLAPLLFRAEALIGPPAGLSLFMAARK